MHPPSFDVIIFHKFSIFTPRQTTKPKPSFRSAIKSVMKQSETIRTNEESILHSVKRGRGSYLEVDLIVCFKYLHIVSLLQELQKSFFFKFKGVSFTHTKGRTSAAIPLSYSFHKPVTSSVGGWGFFTHINILEEGTSPPSHSRICPC
mgnify:CR=1 FL=1